MGFDATTITMLSVALGAVLLALSILVLAWGSTGPLMRDR